MMPDSFRMATLFPEAAMRPMREADPLRDVDMEENVSDYVNGHAAQGGDLGGELVEACVVLALAFVGFGHGGR
ncbi:hypothetical protein HYQ46_008315 [Verticillium longisporum]|nr:hypothetical protein HYQ46_008315 [Verticillium longisporum]